MFEALTRKFADWHCRRTAITQLSQLDDRLLADLGTNRQDIVDFVTCRTCN